MTAEAQAGARPRRIAVVGMGRSGTTLVMELLDGLGVFVDTVNWAMEHEAARAINDSYLELHFGARPGLPYGRLPQSEIVVRDPGWLERARSFAAAMDRLCEDRPAWAFKDPRTTILFDLWRDYVDVAVGIFRAPDLVADSYLAQRWVDGPFARRKVLAYWNRFNRSLLRIADDLEPSRFHLLELGPDFPRQARLLAEGLGLPWRATALAGFDPKRQLSSGVPRPLRRLHRQLQARTIGAG